MTTEEEKTKAPAGSTRRAFAGRLSWGLADQAASSLSNFVVGVYVARSLGLTAFGVFSLAWVTYRRLRSSTANASRQTASVSAIASGETKSRLSAEVWYSG